MERGYREFGFSKCLPRILILALLGLLRSTKVIEPVEMLAFSDF
jgi:hypothetical protein